MTSTAPTLTEDQSQNLPPSAAPPPPVLQDVPTARLMPHPRNPRRDLGDLTDLTASILAAAPSSPSVSPQCRVSPGGCRCARPVVVLVDDATGGGPWCA
ncbi:MAG: hypothetical protein KBF43_16260, partial [Dermatophilaceae bacterium]|nr:hypothetical protein [Dermatophilaceae bacterium]